MKKKKLNKVIINQNKTKERGNLIYLKNIKRYGIKRLSQKMVLFLLLVMIALASILFSPLFSAKHINVTNLEKYTDTEICQKIGLFPNTNIILFGKRTAVKKLKLDPYIASAEVSMKLPDTISIKINERKVRGYVPYMGAYLYIDEYGRVLDTQTFFAKSLPIVNGLQFNHFQLGELLQVDNPQSFDVVVTIAQMMTKYGLLDMVVKIDVSNPKNVHAYVNQVDIRLGDIKDCDQKIRIMAEIMKTIPQEDRGTLDLSDITRPIVFQYLT